MPEQTIDIFIQLVQDHRFWGYGILFLAMVLEGEIFLIIAGMLASIEAFDIGHVVLISFLGVILGNVMWYGVGAKLKDVRLTRRLFSKMEKIMIFFLPKFRENPFKSIFFSKFVYGANRATVIMSGVLKIPFKLFFKAESLASIVWVLLYASIGYFFGQAAVKMTHNASLFALTAVIFVISFIVIQKLITRQYERHERKRLEKNEKENSNS